MTAASSEAGARESQYYRYLDYGKHILNARAEPEPNVVEGCKDYDDSYGSRFLHDQEVSRIDGHDTAVHAGVDIFGKAHGRRRDRRAETDEDAGPSREKSEQRMIEALKVCVLGPLLGHAGRELGVAECSRHRDEPAERPAGEHPAGAGKKSRDDANGGEYTRAYDIGNNDARRGKEADLSVDAAVADAGALWLLFQ